MNYIWNVLRDFSRQWKMPRATALKFTFETCVHQIPKWLLHINGKIENVLRRPRARERKRKILESQNQQLCFFLCLFWSNKKNSCQNVLKSDFVAYTRKSSNTKACIEIDCSMWKRGNRWILWKMPKTSNQLENSNHANIPTVGETFWQEYQCWNSIQSGFSSRIVTISPFFRQAVIA